MKSIRLTIYLCLLCLGAYTQLKAQSPEEQKVKATQYYYKAILALNQGERQEALDLMNYAHQLDPKDADICFRLADLYRRQQNNYKALELYKKAYEADSTNKEFLQGYVVHLNKGKEHTEAIRLMEGWLRRNANDEEVQDFLASVYFNSGAYQKALDLYAQIKKINKSLFSEYARIALLRARLFYILGRNNDMLNELDEFVASYPHDARAKLQAISLLYDNELFQEGKRYLLQLEQKHNLSARELRGLYYPYYRAVRDSLNWEKKLKEELEDSQVPASVKVENWTNFLQNKAVGDTLPASYNWVFDRITTLHPEDGEGQLFYAKQLAMQGERTKSINLFRHLAKILPETPDVWTHLLSQLLDQKQFAEVKTLSREGLKQLPNEWRIAYLGSGAYLLNEQEEEARKYLEEILPKLEAEGAEGFGLSMLYGALGDLYEAHNRRRAYEYYDKALSHNEHNTDVLNNYAYFLALEGKDLARAERLALQALKIKKDSHNLLDTYAWILYLRQNYSLADLYIRKSIDQAGEEVSGTVYDHYGDILTALDKADEARSAWQKAVELYQQELQDKQKAKASKKDIKKLQAKLKRIQNLLRKKL